MSAQAPALLNRSQRRALAQGKLKPRLTADQRHYVARKTERIRDALRKDELATKRALETNDLPFSDPRNVGRIAQVFDPYEAFLTEMETTGELDAMPDGTPLINITNEGMYPVTLVFDTVCEAFEKLSRANGWQCQTEGLRRLQKKFEYVMPADHHDVAAARKTIDWMKSQALLTTPNQFEAEMKEIMIRDALAGKA